MNAKIKALWVEALRSGKYKQGRGQLRIGDTFCCLGVLCDIHRKVTKKNRWSRTRAGDPRYVGSVGTLPDDVVEWAGLGESNPSIEGVALSAWNDAQDANFEEIAQLIEKHL